MREFTGAILNPYDLEDLLHRLTGHATQVLGAAGAGIMLADDDGELDFVAASHQRVIDVETFQVRIRSGACHEAFSTNRIVRLDDVAQEDRWPEYTRHVRRLGLRSVLGVPLNAFGQTIGVINVYREHMTAWTAQDIDDAEILAAMGAGYILNANQLRAQTKLSAQLHTAIESRDVIGQAKGIVMARLKVDGNEAFELLRRRSQRSNRKLRDVAEEIVRRHAAADID